MVIFDGVKLNAGVILFVVLLVGCNDTKTTTPEYQTDPCEQSRYNLITYKYQSYTEWKIEYMDYIAFCLDDSAKAVQLAKMDALRDDYTFLIFGLIKNMEPFESIYRKYPIGFHSPGCKSSEIGYIYNQTLINELKSNMNLDYDSIIDEAFYTEE